MVTVSKKMKERVYQLLRNVPETRDNDGYLLALIMNEDLLVAGHEPKKMSAQDLFILMKSGKVTSPESVRRMRQKLQEEYESLRGNSYKNRKLKAQTIKNQLK